MCSSDSSHGRTSYTDGELHVHISDVIRISFVSCLVALIATCNLSLALSDHGPASVPIAGPHNRPPPPVPRQLANDPSSSAFQGPLASSHQPDDEIYLESIEDLEHVAHLSLRNYNLTDDNLLQSSWFVGPGAGLSGAAHKQHQRWAYNAPNLPSDVKERQALMLELFILHLRNGHLRRLANEELDSIVQVLNQTESLALLYADLRTLLEKQENRGPNASWTFVADEATSRCLNLMTLYKYELLERRKQSVQVHQASRVEYESSQQLTTVPSNELSPLKATSGFVREEATTTLTPSEAPQEQAELFDTRRMFRLCKLAIGCHSPDDLVNLISRPWRRPGEQLPRKRTRNSPAAKPVQRPSRASQSSPGGYERHIHGPYGEQVLSNGDHQSGGEQSFEARPFIDETGRLVAAPRRKGLRESLSLSLSKLCPLILLQLHEEDGTCQVRRDDRPPMITVWAFATLFVTIVCFCSLIGLSLSPLLGPSAAEESSLSDSDDSSELLGREMGECVGRQRAAASPTAASATPTTRPVRHRACLTLFEGLAVGSLVGSALFSLIPQAFELQERESNQSFLLKAFIIFSGIYLFFCSERIMRIILDSRQKRKKKKQLNHRSSTTAAAIEPLEHDRGGHNSTGVHVADSKGKSSSSASKRITTIVEGPATGTRSRSKQRQGDEIVGGRDARGAAGASGSPAKRPIDYSETKTRRSAGSGKQVHSSNDGHHQKVADRKVGENETLVASKPSEQQTSARRERSRQLKAGAGRAKRTARVGVRRADSLSAKGQKSEFIRRKQLEKVARPRRKPGKPRQSESDCDYYNLGELSSSSASETSDSSSSSFALLEESRSLGLKPVEAQESQVDCSTSCLSRNSLGLASSASCCSLALTFEREARRRFEFDAMATDNSSDSDNESNHQARAVSRQMEEYIHRKLKKPTGRASRPTMITAHDYHDDRLAAAAAAATTPSKGDSYRATPPAGLRVFNNQSMGERCSSSNVQRQDISTVAWMIILGDGLHNFIDGISIGAAFSESILSGVSISVAVICEEFPHELGDFAVLVSSGMTVRQALGYNFLSACTCYVGMAVGIILGDVTDGASYISALAAGVFLYIALVDMMGELSATLEAASRHSIAKTLKLLLLQNVGILIGISIIFVLSFIDF